MREKIFEPWMDSMRNQGCKFLEGRRVTDFCFDEETGRISEVICGKESLKADAVILADLHSAGNNPEQVGLYRISLFLP